MAGAFLAAAFFAGADFFAVERLTGSVSSERSRSSTGWSPAVDTSSAAGAAFREPRLLGAAGASAVRSSDCSCWAAAIAAWAMSGTAQSMLRRDGAKLTTTRVTDSPSFITLRALGGGGSAISRSGT